MTDPERITVELPGLTVAALAWGPADGPLLLCLHGFPDTAWTWRRVAPALAADGWRVVAPFSRGYAPTGLATDGCYQAGALVRDAAALRYALAPARRRAVLVGHDWGALTAYGVGDHDPEAFERIVTVAVPPIATYRRALRDPRLALAQARCSWYMLANQLPALPERIFDGYVARLWAAWSPGYDAAEDLELLRRAMPDAAHRRAAIDYYRAILQPWHRSSRYEDEQVAALQVPIAPVLYLAGDRDGCVLPAVSRQAGADLTADSRVVTVPGAGHFVQLEQPDRVAAEIRAFLAAAS